MKIAEIRSKSKYSSLIDFQSDQHNSQFATLISYGIIICICSHWIAPVLGYSIADIEFVSLTIHCGLTADVTDRQGMLTPPPPPLLLSNPRRICIFVLDVSDDFHFGIFEFCISS